MIFLSIGILGLLGLEAIALAVYRRRSHQLKYYAQDLANVGAGGFFTALVLYLAPAKADAIMLACLSGAGVAHVTEVVLRLRSQRRSTES